MRRPFRFLIPALVLVLGVDGASAQRRGPSEAIRNRLDAKNSDAVSMYRQSWRIATPMSASVSVGFLSSITVIGIPFRNTVRSGRITVPDGPATDSCRTTRRWLSPGFSTSISRARPPRVSPVAASRYSTYTPAVSIS